ncbi:diphthine--ammonia ligase [Coemansia sp. RSA 2702]|nr:diphthine--ammonia ligase [Coemansia sp. RSA 2702]
MELPLYTKEIRGTAVTQTLDYELTQDDETEDLFALLSEVKQNHPDVGAVSVGAIFSSYQGNRVQHVCDRLGLKMLAYLWHRDQAELLQEMVANGVDAVLIKVAAMGLGREDLGKTLKEMQPKLLSLHSKFGIHPCGEGGEFESFTLDCPLFKKRIVVDDSAVVTHVDDTVAPVLYLSIKQAYSRAFTDHIYCINQASRLGRKARMTELFAHMQLDAEMFAGSHLDVWQDVINHEYQYALVIEDDVDFELDAVASIHRALNTLDAQKANWDILYIGHCSMEEKPGLARSVHPFCTSGYIVSRNGAQKLFAYFAKHLRSSHALDVQLVALIKRKMLRSYSMFPPVVFQRRDLYPADDGMDLRVGRLLRNSAWDQARAFVPKLQDWIDPPDSQRRDPAFEHIPPWMENTQTVR